MIPPPCANCPWRKDAPREHWHPDHFTSIYRNCRGDGYHEMLCHFAAKEDGSQNTALYCRGWVAVMGFDAVGVRMLELRGKVSAEDVKGADRTGLFRTFEAMLKANEIPLPVVEKRGRP